MESNIKKIGKYETTRVLGKGATATVYLANDPDNARQVAIKLIEFGREHEAVSKRLKKLFQSEDATGRTLKHPNIVQVYDAVIEQNRAYLVMEYVNGKSLDYYCQISKLLPLHRVVGIIFKCCMALDYAYRCGIVHRDIKPANILIDEKDNPKITDFGLALNLRKDIDKDSTFVMGVGSPAYMSPEQIKNYPLNQKTDLYSMGVILFQLLTGRLPFRAQNQWALIYKIVNMDTPSICALNPNLPEGVERIIKKALEKDLFNRYTNGAEFAKDLSSVKYQIVYDHSPEQDTKNFEKLRKLEFFTEFENIELWEVLRVSNFRRYPAKKTLISEGDEGRHFGVILQGSVEVSVEGKTICRLEAGEVVGEMAYLNYNDHRRSATVITLEPIEYLEINSSALDLSSEEVLERFNQLLMSKVIKRLRKANKTISELIGEPATRDDKLPEIDLELVPMETDEED